MTDGENSGGGVNTVLLVILLLLVVGGGVWWFATHRGTPSSGTNINVTLPTSSPGY